MALPVFGAAGTWLTATSAAAANVAVPAGVTAGQIVLVHLYKESTAAVTPPAGFTELTPTPTTTVGVHAGHLFWKRATGADSGTYNFTWTGAVWRAAVATRYTGCVDSGSPVDVQDEASTSTFGSVTPAVSVTTLGPDRLLVWQGTIFAVGAWTEPTNFVERVDVPADGVLSVATRDWPTALGSGSVTGSNASGGDSATAWLIALLPAADTVGRRTPTQWPGVGPTGPQFWQSPKSADVPAPPVDTSTAPYIWSQYGAFH